MNGDSFIQPFLNGKPDPAYSNGHRKALEMEAWTKRNALGMARITDAEEFKRSLRASRH